MRSSPCSVVAVVLFLALLAGKGNAFEVSVESISEFYLPTSVGGVPELDGKILITTEYQQRCIIHIIP